MVDDRFGPVSCREGSQLLLNGTTFRITSRHNGSTRLNLVDEAVLEEWNGGLQVHRLFNMLVSGESLH